MFNLSEDSSVKSSDHLGRIIPSILTDEGKIMLAAIISLLVVILLVLLLHVYGRWFFAESPRSRRRSVSVSHVLGPTRLYHLSTFTYDDTYSGRPANGLEASIIASLPLFVYCSEDYNGGLECVVCLSVFQDDEIGRSLPKCNHAFHVECIDMWLLSNSTCPICRAPVVSEKSVAVTSLPIEASPSQERSQEPLMEIITSESEEGNGDSPLMELISMEIASSERPSSYKEASSSPSTLASPSPLTLGCSLQRMLNRNRSEGRVQSSSGTNESNV